MREKPVTLRPYDSDVADDVFSVLFYGSDKETEAGLMEIPAASYQLVVSALELIRWDVCGDDAMTIRNATAILCGLRNRQELREWNRKDKNL